MINGQAWLLLMKPPDYENPQDIDRDNIYRITITVEDGDGNYCSANGMLSATKTFAIKVIKDTSN